MEQHLMVFGHSILVMVKNFSSQFWTHTHTHTHTGKKIEKGINYILLCSSFSISNIFHSFFFSLSVSQSDFGEKLFCYYQEKKRLF